MNMNFFVTLTILLLLEKSNGDIVTSLQDKENKLSCLLLTRQIIRSQTPKIAEQSDPGHSYDNLTKRLVANCLEQKSVLDSGMINKIMKNESNFALENADVMSKLFDMERLLSTNTAPDFKVYKNEYVTEILHDLNQTVILPKEVKEEARTFEVPDSVYFFLIGCIAGISILVCLHLYRQNTEGIRHIKKKKN